jgi:imidazolonepropionase-like amidohydrolase
VTVHRSSGAARPRFATAPILAIAASLAAQQPAPQVAEREATARPQLIAIEAGMVHPVAGDPIPDGVVLIEGDRIAAVGKRGAVAVPPEATVIAYPEGHVYPGLVDAASTAYLDAGALAEAPADAGTRLADALDPHEDAGREAAAGGVTTAHVGNPGNAAWGGIGAVVHPTPDGVEVAADGGVRLRLSAGTAPGTSLGRQKALRTAAQVLDDLEGYKKQRDGYAELVQKYEKDFAQWLQQHKKNEAPGEARNAAEGAAPGEGRRPRGSRGGRPSGAPAPDGGPGGEAAPADGRTEAATDGNQEASRSGRQGSGEGAQRGAAPRAPGKPTFPRRPARDQAKDALLEVAAGTRQLRVEAHRRDEIRAALELMRHHSIARAVLDGAAQGEAVAAEIASQGVPVVVCPAALPPTLDGERVPDDLPAALHRAGVTVAIGSGDARCARFLPLLAAAAVGAGMPEEAALRAITLTAAEVLGVADQVGSLEPETRGADVLVSSGPLFASDARILRVLAAGKTIHQAR